MSSINNTWVGYLNRSYQTIKNALLSKVTTSNPELTDHGESNIFVIIISMFSGIAEMLNYYVDSMAREGFQAIAQRRSSIIRHSYPLDYRIKARMYESVNVNFNIVDSNSDPINLSSDTLVPAGTSISTTGGITYVTLNDYTMIAGSSVYSIPFVQATLNSAIPLGVTDGTLNQHLVLPSDYVHGTIDLSVGGTDYTNIDSWANADFDDESYIIDVLFDNSIVVELGDDFRGLVPVSGQAVEASFYTTLGPDGSVDPGELVTPPAISLGAGEFLEVSNPLASSGGTFIESTESIRKNSIYSRRLLNRMVTRLDYKNLTESIAGVAKAKIHFCCGKSIDLYIVPEGGGIASQSLIDAVADEVDDKKMAGTKVSIYSAGETYLYIDLTATARKNKSSTQTRADIENALLTFGLETNREINGAIRISDITSLVDNLEKVDYVDLDVLYAIPYANPTNSSTQLSWSREIKSGSVDIIAWSLVYNSGTGNFTLVKDRTFITNVAVGVTYEDDIIKFTINAGAYSDGYRWEFKTYPYTSNLVIDDFTIPRTNIANLNISVKESKEEVITC